MNVLIPEHYFFYIGYLHYLSQAGHLFQDALSTMHIINKTNSSFNT